MVKKIEFIPQQIIQMKIILENGVALNVNPNNIKYFAISHFDMENSNFQIYSEDSNNSTDIFLSSVELTFQLHRKANVIYHSYDNIDGKRKTFERLQKKDIAQIELWEYDSKSKCSTHYVCAVAYTQRDWYLPNQNQKNLIGKDGSMCITIQTELQKEKLR